MRTSDIKGKIPLRELKKARLKIDLLNLLKKKMETRTFDEINATELCKEVMISEVTFYNYFHRKTDLILFYAKIMELEIWMELQTLPIDYLGKQGLEVILENIADRILNNSYLMNEFIHVLMTTQSIVFEQLTPAEIYLSFPEFDSDIPSDISLPNLIIFNIKRAIKQQELPDTIEIELALKSILTILLGAPLANSLVEFKDTIKINALFLKQFNIFWNGLKGFE